VEDRIRKLVEQLFTSEDLRTVQILAVELQRAVYERIEELQKKLVQDASVRSEDAPVIEIEASGPGCSGQPSQATERR
jgi:hypothetical protein